MSSVLGEPSVVMLNDGSEYIAIESSMDSCDGCAFDDQRGRCLRLAADTDRLPCTHLSRDDGISVVWVKTNRDKLVMNDGTVLVPKAQLGCDGCHFRQNDDCVKGYGIEPRAFRTTEFNKGSCSAPYRVGTGHPYSIVWVKPEDQQKQHRKPDMNEESESKAAIPGAKADIPAGDPRYDGGHIPTQVIRIHDGALMESTRNPAVGCLQCELYTEKISKADLIKTAEVLVDLGAPRAKAYLDILKSGDDVNKGPYTCVSPASHTGPSILGGGDGRGILGEHLRCTSRPRQDGKDVVYKAVPLDRPGYSQAAMNYASLNLFGFEVETVRDRDGVTHVHIEFGMKGLGLSKKGQMTFGKRSRTFEAMAAALGINTRIIGEGRLVMLHDSEGKANSRVVSLELIGNGEYSPLDRFHPEHFGLTAGFETARQVIRTLARYIDATEHPDVAAITKQKD